MLFIVYYIHHLRKYMTKQNLKTYPKDKQSLQHRHKNYCPVFKQTAFQLIFCMTLKLIILFFFGLLPVWELITLNN